MPYRKGDYYNGLFLFAFNLEILHCIILKWDDKIYLTIRMVLLVRSLLALIL
jgi:hypothetical protein